MKNLEQLFGSKTRVKLLYLFLLNPERSFFVREITRKLNKRINSVRRELKILSKIGLIKSKAEGRKTFYTVNRNFIFFDEFSNIVEKSGKPQDKVSEVVKGLGKVSFACFSGFFTSNPCTKVDFFLVGDIDRDKLLKFVKRLEREIGKEVNYTILTDAEFSYRQKCRDRFLQDILSSHSVITETKKSKKQ